eukprot:gnl/TRDRNA2_/TRDRNA2_166834_c3_seq1.p1 gnl/TRDRNA2_/TRDRNA2_166834_c3~~gnl/TRDRNA2_/TRDRNA2_166834_c3_seq1.p1  ORF type:complete len:371 (+),score=91.56 gnl/TRDRNA2_/TRDRNA2_166834_c3_seq1:81-1193(+)
MPRPSCALRTSPAAQVRVGTRVRIVSVTQMPECNGKEGTLMEYIPESCRWKVRLDDPAGSGFLLRAQNFEPCRLQAGVRVRIVGVTSELEHNGKEGTLVEYMPEHCRWKVKVDSPEGVGFLLRASHCEPCGDVVAPERTAPQSRLPEEPEQLRANALQDRQQYLIERLQDLQDRQQMLEDRSRRSQAPTSALPDHLRNLDEKRAMMQELVVNIEGRLRMLEKSASLTAMPSKGQLGDSDCKKVEVEAAIRALEKRLAALEQEAHTGKMHDIARRQAEAALNAAKHQHEQEIAEVRLALKAAEVHRHDRGDAAYQATLTEAQRRATCAEEKAKSLQKDLLTLTDRCGMYQQQVKAEVEKNRRLEAEIEQRL